MEHPVSDQCDGSGSIPPRHWLALAVAHHVSVGSKENPPKHPKSDNLDQDELDQVAKTCPIKLQKRARPCFVTKSVRFGRTELLFFFRVANREIYNLSMVSGPVLLKIKGKCWIFGPSGVRQVKKKRKRWTKSVNSWSLEL